jgi:transposase
MSRDQFWLTEQQFSKIEPHLPADTRGKARVDDRRVINGFVHVPNSDGGWIDAPHEYGPMTPSTIPMCGERPKAYGSVSFKRRTSRRRA